MRIQAHNRYFLRLSGAPIPALVGEAKRLIRAQRTHVGALDYTVVRLHRATHPTGQTLEIEVEWKYSEDY